VQRIKRLLATPTSWDAMARAAPGLPHFTSTASYCIRFLRLGQASIPGCLVRTAAEVVEDLLLHYLVKGDIKLASPIQTCLMSQLSSIVDAACWAAELPHLAPQVRPPSWWHSEAVLCIQLRMHGTTAMAA
jgi:hypothetical protein